MAGQVSGQGQSELAGTIGMTHTHILVCNRLVPIGSMYIYVDNLDIRSVLIHRFHVETSPSDCLVNKYICAECWLATKDL